MSEVFVEQLHVYPIKSCQGISVSEAAVTSAGFEYDREWVIINDDDRAGILTQRKDPDLAKVRVAIDDSYLSVTAPEYGTEKVDIEYKPADDPINTRVFGSAIAGIDEGEDIAFFLSEFLHKPVRLLRASREEPRYVKPEYRVANGYNKVKFGDGFPFLLTSVVSLEYLNTLKDQRVPMNRFRPNIVVNGDLMPFEEDEWGNVSIGGLRAHVRCACDRCTVPTITQTGPEAGNDGGINVLDEFLDVREGIDLNHPTQKRGRFFGQNVLNLRGSEGVVVKIGDSVEPTYWPDPNVMMDRVSY